MKTIFHKVKKAILWVIGITIVFVILVVVLVDRDENTGKITISFSNKGTKVSNVGFADLIDDEMGLVEIGAINWAEAYNEALEEKYKYETEKPQLEGSLQPSITFSQRKENEAETNLQNFINYLKESETQLNESENPIKIAIEYRDKNQRNKIGEIINSLDKKIEHVEKIIPSEEIVGYHLTKLCLLEDINEILKNIRDSEKGENLEDIVSEEQFRHLAKLNLILKEYLTYFLYKG